MKITSIRYINMDRNWHRKLFIKSLLAETPYKVFRCPGVNFDIENTTYHEYLKGGIHPNVEKARVNGVVGCWIAHSHALEGVTEQKGITVVIEDDFVCHSQFFKNAMKMINAFNREFDVILFDTWGEGPLEAHKVAGDIYRTENYSAPYYGGAHCLFVNNASIQKILAAKLNAQVMDYDGFLLASGKLDTFVFYTGQCAQREIGSDISPYYHMKYDVVNILMAFLPAVVREKANRFKKLFHKPAAKKVIDMPEKALRDFEGYYEIEGQKDAYIKFAVKEGKLTLTQLWDNQEIWLLPFSEVDFFSKEFPGPLRFSKDERGVVKEVVAFNSTVCKKVKKAISLTSTQLKVFEGRYQESQNSAVAVQVIARLDHLLVKQLWDGSELSFEPESELSFFSKYNPSFPIRFAKDKTGEIAQVIASERDILEKVEGNEVLVSWVQGGA